MTAERSERSAIAAAATRINVIASLAEMPCWPSSRSTLAAAATRKAAQADDEPAATRHELLCGLKKPLSVVRRIEGSNPSPSASLGSHVTNGFRAWTS
jgi:hypothetical protein